MQETVYLIIGLMMAILIGWTLYMVTFRTDDFLRLAKFEEERRRAQSERVGKAIKGGVWLFKLFRGRT